MFDHVTIRVSDREASERFYTTLLGMTPRRADPYTEWGDFSISQADEFPLSRHLHVAFSAAGANRVDDDPDGNRVEAVHNDKDRRGIDHLRLRVADPQASKAFYETIAPFAGIRLGDDTPERVRFTGPGASCSFVAGSPLTEHVHLAFPATDDATVDAFHRAATDAGYRDHGAPGERAIYHPGYYGAFVLDPDGHNVEVVNHNR